MKIYVHINNIISAIFMITATEEYFFAIFFSNFLVPICNVHMSNSNANENVSNAALRPAKNEDKTVIKTNMEIVFNCVFVVQFISFAYHFDLMSVDVFFAFVVFNK